MKTVNCVYEHVIRTKCSTLVMPVTAKLYMKEHILDSSGDRELCIAGRREYLVVPACM